MQGQTAGRSAPCRPPRAGRAPPAHRAPAAAGPPPRHVSARSFFKGFRQDSKSAGITGSQRRDDFDRDDVEHYFNYMGCLAVEGTYDRMYALLSAGIPPIDVILLFAAAEADLPKLEELCEAGADVNVADLAGQRPADLAGRNNPGKREDARALLATYAARAAAA